MTGIKLNLIYNENRRVIKWKKQRFILLGKYQVIV